MRCVQYDSCLIVYCLFYLVITKTGLYVVVQLNVHKCMVVKSHKSCQPLSQKYVCLYVLLERAMLKYSEYLLFFLKKEGNHLLINPRASGDLIVVTEYVPYSQKHLS